MQKELPKIRSVHMTNLYLSVPENLAKFLKVNFQVITVEGEKRYTCGQEHTRENPNWEPFKHFEPYCLEQGLDEFEVRDFLGEHLGRPIICQCDILIDRNAMRKRDIARYFGMDFEGYEYVG